MYYIDDLGKKRSPAIPNLTFQMIYDTPSRLPKLKISWRRGKRYTSPVTLWGRHNESKEANMDRH